MTDGETNGRCEPATRAVVRGDSDPSSVIRHQSSVISHSCASEMRPDRLSRAIRVRRPRREGPFDPEVLVDEVVPVAKAEGLVRRLRPEVLGLDVEPEADDVGRPSGEAADVAMEGAE